MKQTRVSDGFAKGSFTRQELQDMLDRVFDAAIRPGTPAAVEDRIRQTFVVVKINRRFTIARIKGDRGLKKVPKLIDVLQRDADNPEDRLTRFVRMRVVLHCSELTARPSRFTSGVDIASWESGPGDDPANVVQWREIRAFLINEIANMSFDEQRVARIMLETDPDASDRERARQLDIPFSTYRRHRLNVQLRLARSRRFMASIDNPDLVVQESPR